MGSSTLPQFLQQQLECSPTTDKILILRYITTTFPRLLAGLYKDMKPYKNNENFKEFYPK